MATVQVRLPGLLAQIVGGARTLKVEAATVQEAINRALTNYPALKVHLYDELGELRPHVNLFHNETNTRWLPSLDTPVQDGDTLLVMQAVSGGC
jgi:adenylyltransferase/sulfurtransferase